MKAQSTFILFFLLLLFSESKAQSTIDFKRIKQKNIRKSILLRDLHNAADFTKVESSCLCKEDKQFNVHSKSYLFDFKLSEVWQAYQEIQPKDAWNDKIVSFGLLFEENKKELYYVGQTVPKSSVGQLIYINLHFLHGLLNVAVAHKIMEINDPLKLIRTCYVKDGKSKGTQFIRFYKMNENQTKVEHITFYKSDSKFRDKFLYPWLHAKVIREFHGNVNNYLIINDLKKKAAFDAALIKQ